jgi:CheY-like chemotaxis protein
VIENSQMPILWIDDDGPRRFVYEQKLLERDGWQVSWAGGVAEAVDALASRSFLAVLLDQTLPMGSPLSDRANVWQGCLLLHWLRGKPFPSQAPQIDEWERMGRLAPLDENRAARVILVSAYYDHEVDAAIRQIEPHLVSIVKPIDAASLVRALLSLRKK